MSNRVGIVIPVFNRIEETRQCLDCLKKQTYQHFDIIICDDNSSDNTKEVLKNEYPYVYIIEGNGELWWTGGTNKAIEFTLENLNVDYILTLNNDVLIDENYLTRLIESARKYPNAIIGSLSLTKEDKPKILFGGIKNINWFYSKIETLNDNYEIYNKNEHRGIVESEYLIGRGTLIPVNVIYDIGLFNFKSLPHYMSDTEYSLRASKNGYKLLLDREAVVYTVPNELIDNTELNKKLFKDYFLNRRSPFHLKSRVNFAVLQCPKRYLITYIISDFLRLVVSYYKNKHKQR
ncbi:glycosyltransferase family 2 protein [Ferdinandcohnia sp. Marseille-Q9671]